MMKLKVKVMCAVGLLMGLCSPAFSTDYAAVFKQVMNVEPQQASVVQLQEFYQRYAAEKEEKAQLLQEMASWKEINVYEEQMPSVEFMNFALAIENKLPQEEDSVLVPVYKDILERAGTDTEKNIKQWTQKVEDTLGNKTIQVGEFNVRASWVARSAIFQAVLQQGALEQNNPIAYVNIIDSFAVKNVLFGANHPVRKQLMRQLLARATQAVAEGAPAVVCTSSSRCVEGKKIAGAGSKENISALYRLEKIMKAAGGEGLNPADPNLKKIRAGRNEIMNEVLRQRLKVMWEQGSITGLGIHTQVR